MKKKNQNKLKNSSRPYEEANTMLDELRLAIREFNLGITDRRETRLSATVRHKQKLFRRYLIKYFKEDRELFSLARRLPIWMWWYGIFRMGVIYWLFMILLYTLNITCFHIYIGITFVRMGTPIDVIIVFYALLSICIYIYVYTPLIAKLYTRYENRLSQVAEVLIRKRKNRTIE